MDDGDDDADDIDADADAVWFGNECPVVKVVKLLLLLFIGGGKTAAISQ